jgi:flap endonuclease-1
MGIKNLNKFIRNHCPDVFEQTNISEYAYKKIAIDISLNLCKYKTVCGDRWLSAFINLVSCLRKNNVHCVFIYDGGSPPEKAEEKAERVANREKVENRVFMLEQALEKYYLTGEVDPILKELNDKSKDELPKKLLRLPTESSSTINIELVRFKVEKMRSYILDISPEDFQLTRDLFDIMNVPWFKAPMEAETMCSDLCRRGIVDAVLSDDTDVLAYGCPIFLTKLDTNSGDCVKIHHNDLLEKLSLDYKSFVDLCIMCGCDYNKNIFRVGPEKAYKLLLDHKNIDELALKGYDVSVLNHIRVRELFLEYIPNHIDKVPFCGYPDTEKLQEFFTKHNVNFNIDSLVKSYTQDFIFIED